MKPKVSWTSREWSRIAQWFLNESINPDARGFKQNLCEAQKAVLPAERHRTLVGLSKEVRLHLKEEISMLLNETKPKAPVSAPPTIQDLSTEDLLVELAHRIARFLEPKSAEETRPVDRGFHPKHDPTPPREARTAKKKVLIVGPMGWQKQRLVQQFPLLDLRFCSVANRPEDVYVKGLHCSEIILWTKFVTHAQQDQAKLSEVPRWYANGLEEIEARLRSLHG